jgi:hypothetical protein
LLDGLEIFDEDEEIATDDFLADRAAPDHLPKALAPDGHLPMRRLSLDMPREGQH